MNSDPWSAPVDATPREPPESDEVRVYYAFTSHLSEEQVRGCEKLLATAERERMQRFRFLEDRHSYLLAHALVRSVLSAVCQVPAQALRIEENRGRPELCFPQYCPRLRFNLSHTRGLAACALSLQHDVGIDVERVDYSFDIDGVATSVLSHAERVALSRFTGTARYTYFFKLWTLKEAYIKAVGKGLALPLEAITLQLESDATPRITFTEPMKDDTSMWWLHVADMEGTHSLAVASNVSGKPRFSMKALIPK